MENEITQSVKCDENIFFDYNYGYYYDDNYSVVKWLINLIKGLF